MNWKIRFHRVGLAAAIICTAPGFVSAQLAGSGALGMTGAASAAVKAPEQEAEDVMRAFRTAYPRIITRVTKRDGDWAVFMRGKWFYYADGKLLPEELRGEAASYQKQPFYQYHAELPEWKAPDENRAKELANAASRRAAAPHPRSPAFFDTLWNASTREEAWAQIKTIKFLGREVLVHHAILEPLTLVEQRIQSAAKTEASVAEWIKNLTQVTAWNWRDIADTKTRSNHAYGTAIDCVMNEKGGHSYWLWTAEKKSDWWNVPYSSRLHPPVQVIQAFEAYGFVWGGKWMFYDTMHFEYRPEIFHYNHITMTGEY